MFRVLARCGASAVRNSVNQRQALIASIRASSHSTESAEQIDKRYEDYFNKPTIDGWELRKGMCDMHGMDMVPNPQICIAALKACRRINDFALAVRFLEALKEKTETVPDLYNHVMKEIQPTLTELGISTPAELGYDEPELFLESPHDIH